MELFFQTETILQYLKKVHKTSRTLFVLFDNEKKIYYANDSLLKKFNFTNNILGKPVNFLFLKENESLIPFSNLSLDIILKGSQVFSYFNEKSKENFYFVCSFYAGENEKNKFYYSILKEITNLEKKLMEQSIQALVAASQLKDNDTGFHVKRLNEYSLALSKHIYNTKGGQYPEINIDFIEEISKVASMHDIGKIGTPDSILTKPTRLNEDEFIIMKEHTINGAFILSKMAGQMARDIALFHHERWDGNGYPYQLKDTQIPLCARIVSIADVYDALRMQRIYKNEYSHEEVKKYLIEESGKRFEPDLVKFFLEIEEEFNNIFERMKDTGEILKIEDYTYNVEEILNRD